MSMAPTNSDSEDDLDYAPPADASDSESSDDHFELGNAADSVSVAPLTDPEQKRQRDALWASFQASVATPASTGNAMSTPTPARRVKIERTYLFAGKHVTEVVEIPEDSEEAKKWPRWPRPPASDTPTPSSQTDKENEKGKGGARSEGEGDLEPPPPTTVTPGTGAKRPGPRKSRTTLPSIPKGAQAKKITTLDKCAMDWRTHVSSESSDVKDELDANRRGGGYLEKVEFLKRVEGRRDDAFEASKASKRRKM